MQTLSPGGVVLAYDGSPDADRAVRWAVQIAQQYGAPLQLVTAREVVPEPVRVAGGRTEWEQAAEDLLARGARLVAESGGREPEQLAVFLPPVEALLTIGRTARLLVVGARGHTRLGGVLLGSVSQHVSRHAPCPVAVVREQSSPRAEDVVVGVDDSAEARDALQTAFELAQARHAPVVAVHGWSPKSGEQVGGRLPPTGEVVDRRAAAEQMVEAAVEPLRKRFPEVEVTIEAVPVHPARLLVDASSHAAVVVVGSRGRGAFAGLLLGSVSQSVLNHAGCPVVVVR